MRKADIKEGVTYTSKTLAQAYKVIHFTDDRALAEKSAGAPLPVASQYVIFTKVRGPGAPAKGLLSALTADGFAAWAHSEDTGAHSSASDLREENERLREALKPFAALSAMDPHRKGIICGIDHTDIRWEHMHRAAELVG